jgi:hypothetical protein
MISRHFLLVAMAVLAAIANAQTPEPSIVPQPCPFDCAVDQCNTTSQTCTSCVSGFQLVAGRCHLEQCNTAQAHKARNATDGERDDQMADWRVTSVDGTTHTVTVEVTVPPRFHCDVTGHALTDALAWETWLDAKDDDTDKCNGNTETPLGFCGPTDKRWTPVLMLGRESDEPIGSDIKGYLRLPRNDNDTSCISAYRRSNNNSIVDRTGQANSLVTSYNPDTRTAVMTLPLMDLADPDDYDLHCSELREIDLVSGIDVQGEDGKRFQYWLKSIAGTITTWRFDATLCYVDEDGEQSVCPFSSPVWEMTVNGITDGVSVTPAGVAELIYVPKCELYIRSAQIRYAGEITNRNATGEYEISVICQGADYMPNITDIDHCRCEKDDSTGKCIILEEESSCADDNSTCQVSAMFKSTNFNASLSDFLQFECPTDAALEDGAFVVEISHDENNCYDADPTKNDCVDINNAKLFGAAPLQATDELRDQLGPYNDSNTHSIYAGLMKSNDLRVPVGEEEYFHQFNRTYLENTLIRRVVGPEQKNSFVMCAMMQPDALSGTIDPEDLSYKFKITIQEVTFNVTWREEGRANTETTLSELLEGNLRWPSQWVWEHQEDLALRREVIGRVRGRANAPCDGGVCQVTPMQDHVYAKSDDNSDEQWDHIQENIDCVGISPFYLYSLLTLDDPEAIVDSAGVTLTTYHEYKGRYIKDDAGRRRLLQANPNDATYASGRAQQAGGAFQWVSKSDLEAEANANNNVVTKEQAVASETSSIPMMPIVIGGVAASMTCMFFAAFAFWRRRKQPQQDKKLGPEAQFTIQRPQASVQLDDIQLSQAGQV